MNSVPLPGVLSTSIFPLCKSTICLTMERPKPVPQLNKKFDLVEIK